MALTITYPGTYTNCYRIFRTTGGGVTFSANLVGAVFDYFTDTAVVNDAIYFSQASLLNAMANLKVNVGTAIAGTGITGVWEYKSGDGTVWETCHDLTDPTNGFTVTGAATIIFPLQAGATYSLALNGVSSYCWVRYRLTAITTLTEGGANQTTIPQTSLGKVEVTGTDDTTPATFADVYSWIITNAPECGATNPAPSIYKFDNLFLTISSRLLSRDEQIFMGNGCGNLGTVGLQYLESGTLVGTDGWNNGSSFYFCYKGNNVITTSANTKMYGATMGYFSNYVNSNQRNPAQILAMGYGEWVGCNFLDDSGYFVSVTSNKCTMPGNLITTSFPANYPTNLIISNPRDDIWRLYSAGGTISGVKYSLPTVSVFRGFQFGGSSSTQINVNLINPQPSLPEQTDSVKVLNRSMGSAVNLTNCLFYDASAGTYTDYTTAAGNTTVDDVPLSGDVGDILYFRNSSTFLRTNTPMFIFTITNQTNDYEYVWEQYISSGWITCPLAADYDGTANFTQTGNIYLAQHDSIAQVAINGTTGYWFRLRIVTKGTGTPTCTRIQVKQQTWAGNWKIYEKMTTQFKVVDDNGDPIENVDVVLVDANDVETALTTDANGETTANETIISTTQFDPLESDANYNVRKDNSNPFTITVSKTGYETYTKIASITGQLYEIISLKPIVPIRLLAGDGASLALQPELGSSSLLKKV